MKQPGARQPRRVLPIALAFLVLCGSRPLQPPASASGAGAARSRPSTGTTVPAADAVAGRALFTGQARMQNGGPPCAACHSISGLRFPNGGVVGPDLSGIYQGLGSEGTDLALQTLFFPTMMPLYEKRPLTPGEQQALKGFLAQAGTTPVGSRETVLLAALAFGGFVILVAAAWLAWRGRLRGVRAPLVQRCEIRP